MAIDKHEHHDHPEVGTESADLEIGPIIRFAVGLVVVSAVIYIACFGIYKILEKLEDQSDVVRYPMASERAKEPPLPRLQPDPITELQEFRKREAESIISGKIDPNAPGIPVDKAIDQLVNQGLPVRPAKEGQTYNMADHMPADSSSARTLERRMQ